MLDWLYHKFVGNDEHPLIVAACRALAGAMIVGGTGFLGVWQSTDDVKILISAGVGPFLSYLGVRLGVEGALDSWKSGRPPRESL